MGYGRSGYEDEDQGGRDRRGRGRSRPSWDEAPASHAAPPQQGRPFQSRPQAGPSERVVCTVKWFDPAKGFGFLETGDGGPDPFLHAKVLEASGYRELKPGATITCEVTKTAKGLSVTSVESVDETTATEERPRRPSFQSSGPRPERQDRNATTHEREGVATVKWFNADKGFGFMVDESGADVFVHATAVEGSGIARLREGDRFRVRIGRNGKGLCVTHLTPL